MIQSRQTCRAPDVLFVRNSRRGDFVLDAGRLHVWRHVRQGRRWGWDGASLELASGFPDDPIGYKGSKWNLYEYVGGSPLLRTDPTGQFETDGDRLTECYEKCAKDYPNPWQYLMYAGCIVGCDLGSTGQDVTLCNYVNSWSGCYKLGLQCVCGFLAVADAVPLPPVASQIAGGLDCACAAVTALQDFCAANPTWPSMVVLAVADCGTELVNMDKVVNSLTEVMLELLNEGGLTVTGGESTPVACCRWKRDCG